MWKSAMQAINNPRPTTTAVKLSRSRAYKSPTNAIKLKSSLFMAFSSARVHYFFSLLSKDLMVRASAASGVAIPFKRVRVARGSAVRPCAFCSTAFSSRAC